ncbi:High affinity cAMP-specific and IBMX-insensitive 3',5'-cyclic phosphodiesterase 9A [Cladochytrium tenue]|nr:High affinity cAMP-specific and IBMX-insensitive 3',5'-cyclic phosphodiesterase 9A [Cladochytrium tenue]
MSSAGGVLVRVYARVEYGSSRSSSNGGGDSSEVVSIAFSRACTPDEVLSVFLAAANVGGADEAAVSLRLQGPDGAILPIGPSLQPNSKDPKSIYKLSVKQNRVVAYEALSDVAEQLVQSTTAARPEEIEELKKAVGQLKLRLEGSSSQPKKLVKYKVNPRYAKDNKYEFTPMTKDYLRQTNFDNWQFDTNEILSALEFMFVDLGLVNKYKIEIPTLRQFLCAIRDCYNENLIAALTELAIVYNDASPLENHHAAVLFTILSKPEFNILKALPDSTYRELRKGVIRCILSTDMAKHGDIMATFKKTSEAFSYDDADHRLLLLQMLMKCADISNEKPWVEALLEEFFCQSDKEKEEGLPYAPFMDREKVTKAGAQIGFIQYVMLPLYDLVAKVVPGMEQAVIAPIKESLQYYKAMQEREKAEGKA